MRHHTGYEKAPNELKVEKLELTLADYKLLLAEWKGRAKSRKSEIEGLKNKIKDLEEVAENITDDNQRVYKENQELQKESDRLKDSLFEGVSFEDHAKVVFDNTVKQKLIKKMWAFIEGQKGLPADFAKVIDDKFWDLIKE